MGDMKIFHISKLSPDADVRILFDLSHASRGNSFGFIIHNYTLVFMSAINSKGFTSRYLTKTFI